jgi:hypothetical protein
MVPPEAVRQFFDIAGETWRGLDEELRSPQQSNYACADASISYNVAK